MTHPDFEEIRPYTDEEIPAAMQRIAGSELFPLIASYVFPGRDIEKVRSHIASIDSIRRFQKEIMTVVNEQVIRRSIDAFTYNGLEHLDPDRIYLFVSNHRDIMLDSSLLQYILLTNGHDTSEITFGANLMTHPLVVDIGKSNKMFKIERGGNFKGFYRSSLLNSEYIRHTLLSKHQSVWIAQRNGRTKDGLDHTEPGLISMFLASSSADKIKSLEELAICPVAISYEWETCDIGKTLELYESRFTKYVKKPGEDLSSILNGLISYKGNVHLEICAPISESDLMPLEALTKQEYVKAVAKLIDSRINASYRLHPNNFIAYDIRYATNKYAGHYTPQQKEMFLHRLDQLSEYEECDIDILTDIFLAIYSNPVSSKMEQSRISSCQKSTDNMK